LAITTTYPGVYIQELPSQVHTIAGVAMSITAFVGFTARGIDNRAEAIFSFADFERLFGGLEADSELSYAVQQFFANGGTQGYVVRVPSHGATGAAVRVGNTAAASPKPDLTFTALSSGTWADGALLIGVDYNGVDQVSDPTAFNLTVTNLLDGTVESFPSVSLNGSNANYLLAVLNDPDTGSQLVNASDRSWPSWPTGTQTAVPAAPPAVTGILGATAPDIRSLGGVSSDHDYGVSLSLSAPTNSLPAVDIKVLSNGAPNPQSIGGLASQLQATFNAALAVAWPGTSVICQATRTSGITIIFQAPGTQPALAPTSSLTPSGTTINVFTSSVGNSTTSAVQMLSFGGNPTGGTFTLKLGGNTTGAIAWNPDPSVLALNIQTALGKAPVSTQTTVRPWAQAPRVIVSVPNFPDGVLAIGPPSAQSHLTDASVALGLKSPASANVAYYALGTSNSSLGSEIQSTGGSDGSGLPQTGDLIGDPGSFTGLYALDKIDLFNLLIIPDATRALPGNPLSLDPTVNPAAIYSAAITYCQNRRAFLLLDNPPDVKDVASAVDWKTTRIGVHQENGAAFFPRLRLPDPLNNYQLRTFAASGVVAGLYARIDAARGVWKAPAGTEATLTGVQALVYKLTDIENGVLNPLGLNCFRIFPIYGPVLWGARTLVGADAEASQWKYVPVRRVALYIEESLYRGTKWAVFEPNDEPLWAQLRLNIGAFMHDLFRKGAFQGQSPKDAYFVKCDKDTTTQNDIDNGVVNILVGFAPLKPAEFVVIQIQQMAGQVQT
jgi:phage tail sheath protein FI